MPQELKDAIVIGTVHGDIHDIGRDVVALLLGIGGYTVHDLGTDVPVEDFVAAIQEHDPDIVGLSGLLAVAFAAMKDTVDENVRAYTGADGWGADAGRAITLADEWTDGGA